METKQMYLIVQAWKDNRPLGSSYTTILSYVVLYENKRQAQNAINTVKLKLESLEKNQKQNPDFSSQIYQKLRKIFSDLGWPANAAPGSRNFHEIKFTLHSVGTIPS